MYGNDRVADSSCCVACFLLQDLVEPVVIFAFHMYSFSPHWDHRCAVCRSSFFMTNSMKVALVLGVADSSGCVACMFLTFVASRGAYFSFV